jgi:hypothetical protein
MASNKATQMTKGNEKIDVSKPVENLPAHLQGKTETRGSENVGSSDIIIPRIEIAQSNSKCLIRNDPAYIPGCKAGDLYNSVTREVYGSQVVVCPIIFKKEWLLWKDRKKAGNSGGNGFRGAYNTEAEALKAKRDLGDEGAELLNTETHQQFVTVINSKGKPEDAVLSMSRTKIKVSKGWNSLIRMNGGDRFARLYKVSTAQETNDQGTFYNFVVGPFGFAPEPIYVRAEALYELAMKGQLVADRTFDDYGNDVGGERSGEM